MAALKRKRLISQNDPTEFLIEQFTTFEIYNEVSEFLMRNFKGAITFELTKYEPGFIHMSADGIAFFFKYLLNAIFGRNLVHVKMCSETDKFEISINWKHVRDFTETELKSLNYIAYVSGLDIEIGSDGETDHVILKTKTLSQAYIPIYANARRRITEAFYCVFFYG